MLTDRGFTLIELITVLLLVGALSVTVATRFQDSDSSEVQSSRDQLVAALFFAQQKAMDVSGAVQLTTSANSINVTLDGAPTGIDSFTYPVTLPAQISLTSATLNYNRLGETSGASITVAHNSGASAVVQISDSGYAK